MKLLLTFTLIALGLINYAQHTFFNNYGGSGNDYGESVVCTNDYGFVIIGATESMGNGATDMYLMKIDSAGNFVWSKTFGGENIDWGTDITKAIDSGLVFSGYSNSNSTSYNAVITKTDSAGNLIWQKTYGGEDWDFAYSLVKSPDSGYVVVGETFSYGAGQSDGYVLKLDANGDTLWTATYGGLKEDQFYDVIALNTGDFICVGKSSSYSTYGDSDFWIVSLDASGSENWNITLGDTLNDWANGAFQSNNDNIQVIGTLTDTATNIENWWVYEFDTLGNYISQSPNYQTSDNQGVSLIGYPNQDTIFLNAMTTSYGNGGYDLYYSRIDIYLWLDLSNTSTFGGYEDDIINDTDTTYEGGFISVGTTYSTDLGQSNVAVFLLDSNYFIPNSNTSEYEDITSIEINEENLLRVFPNPSNGKIMVNHADKIDFKLYNITGEVLFNKSDYTSQLIDFSEFSKGVYLLKVSCLGKEQTFKLVLE